MERLAGNKQRSRRFHMERFNLKKLKEVEGKEQYCIEVSNRFAALEDLNTLASGMRHIKVKILKEEDTYAVYRSRGHSSISGTNRFSEKLMKLKLLYD
jgi:hypothetical protein